MGTGHKSLVLQGLDAGLGTLAGDGPQHVQVILQGQLGVESADDVDLADGQMALGTDYRYGADIQGISRSGFVCTNTPLTEHDVRIALGGDIFRRIQPFVDGGAKASL